MARGRPSPWPASVSRRSLAEWLLLALVIGVLVLLFTREVRVVQAQAERAAVRATLGALRTALVLDHLQKNAGSPSTPVALTTTNPFDLLQRRPLNYFGPMSAAQALAAPPGSWVFDSVCGCVGYLPMAAEQFDSPSGELMAWYQVTGAPGPLQLVAREAYGWQGEALN